MKSYKRITKSHNDDARVIRAEDIITIRIMRVRVVREAIRVRITGVRIAVRSIIGIAVRAMTANYRIVEVVRLGRIIVSGAEGIAPVTQAHSPAPTSFTS